VFHSFFAAHWLRVWGLWYGLIRGSPSYCATAAAHWAEYPNQIRSWLGHRIGLGKSQDHLTNDLALANW
jgi:hypothetical protein